MDLMFLRDERTNTGGWSEWVDHIFTNDLPFVEIMKKRWSHATHTFLAAWGEFSPSLEDVHVLLKLPLFGDYDVSAAPVDSHIIDKAKELKAATIDGAKYSRDFLSKLCAEPLPSNPNVKTRPQKVKGTSNVLPLTQRKVAHESLKYTYATWVSFYGWLDQIQDQLFSSFGLFPINCFVDLIFLQCFLFERFPEYAPVRTIPDHPSKGVTRPLEPRALHHLYQESEFSSCNVRLHRAEGVFDIWRLILHPQVLPDFIITDTVSIAGFVDFAEAMKVVLFKLPESLLPFDASLFVPPDRAGRVLDLWVAYYRRLKSSIKRYEQQDSMQVFPNLQIMCKDPYYVTARVRQPEEREARVQQTKKRKLVSLNKGPIATPSSSEGPAPPSKGSCKNRKVTQSDPAGVSTNTKKPSTCSSRMKKQPLLPTHKSERLKAKSRRRSLSPTSFSNPIVIRGPADRDEGDESSKQVGHTTNEVPDEVVQDSPSFPVVHETTQGSFVNKVPASDKETSLAFDHSVAPNDDVENCAETRLLGSPQDACAVEEPVAAKEIKPLPTCGSMNETRSEGAPGGSPVAALICLDAGAEKKDASASTASILVSLLPDSDGAIIREFVSRHTDFSFPDPALPSAFLKPAYVVLADLLHFIRAHTAVDLMCLHKGKIASDLEALALFGFKGGWLDQLARHHTVPLPSAALEDLQKITNGILEQEQRNSDIKVQLERLTLDLANGESEFERLKIKQKEIEDVHAGLASLFSI
ncbi:hypothetical protein SESBI_24938 [Sesbania bispinosa]|nr:hypothetical protein SESBI_24938 [Sesbania bispinosa]